MAAKFEDEPGYQNDGYEGHGSQSTPDDSQNSQDTSSDSRGDLGDIQNQEAAGATDNGGSGQQKNDNESAKNDNGWFSEDGGAKSKGSKLKDKFKLNKKKGIIGFITGGFVGGGILGLSILSGPAELIQLGSILEKPQFGTEKNSSIRLSAALRYAKTGDIGETRVSIIGSRVFRATMSQLQDIGIDFARDPLTGRPRAMTIDTDKHPKFKGMSRSTAIRAISQEFDIPQNAITRSGTTFTVDTSGLDIKATRSLSKNAITPLDDGKIVTAMRTRTLAKFFHTPSLFSPLSRYIAEKEDKVAKKADERRKAQAEKTEEMRGPIKEKFSAARASLRDKFGGKAGLATSVALMASSGMCLVRNSAKDAAEYNHGITELAAQAATFQVVVKDLVKDNQITMDQARTLTENLRDEEGKSVHESKELKSLTDPSNTKGVGLTQEYKQAFAPGSTEKDINSTLGGGAVGAVLCSPVGMIGQGVASLALLLAGPVSGGTSWAVFAAKQGASTVATASFMYLIGQRLTDELKSDVVIPNPVAGPIGGGILAYGSQEMGNLVSAPGGGVPLSTADVTALDQEQIQAEAAKFKQKSMFAKLFDTNDYRTPAGQFASSLSPSVSQNVVKFASSITRIGSIIPSIFSSLTPKLSAQKETTQWDIDRLGIPKEVLEDKNLEDPYDNAEKTAAILQGSSGQGYIDKAMTCWGVEISKDSEGWNAVVKEEVNRNTEKYVDANCGDISDYNWRRMILFTFDTATFNAVDCWTGNVSACEDIGMEPPAGDASAAGSATDSIASETFDVSLLEKDSDNIACAPNTKEIRNDDGYRAGNKIRVKLCEITNLPQTSGYGSHNGHATTNSVVSGAVYAMVEAAKQDGVDMSAASTFRTMADQQSLCPCDGVNVAYPGTSNHQLGVAIDFGGNGTLMDKSNPMWKWLSENAEKFGYKPYVKEDWHWSPFGS